MAAAQAGDAAAYVELLEAITPKLRRIIRRQRRFFPEDRLEDLVQDVLLSVHSVRGTYNPHRPFMPWLLAIARNRLVDAARRYARGAAHEVQVEDVDVTISEMRANPRSAEYGDTEALKEAIRELPRGQRQAIEM